MFFQFILLSPYLFSYKPFKCFINGEVTDLILSTLFLHARDLYHVSVTPHAYEKWVNVKSTHWLAGDKSVYSKNTLSDVVHCLRYV
jgi:hypothetical protein